MNHYERLQSSLEQLETFISEAGQPVGSISGQMAREALTEIQAELLRLMLESEGRRLRYTLPSRYSDVRP